MLRRSRRSQRSAFPAAAAMSQERRTHAYVAIDTAEERLGPSEDAEVANRLDRGQHVPVFEEANGWSRVTGYYDHHFDGRELARWIKSSSPSPNKPPPPGTGCPRPGSARLWRTRTTSGAIGGVSSRRPGEPSSGDSRPRTTSSSGAVGSDHPAVADTISSTREPTSERGSTCTPGPAGWLNGIRGWATRKSRPTCTSGKAGSASCAATRSDSGISRGTTSCLSKRSASTRSRISSSSAPHATASRATGRRTGPSAGYGNSA